MIELYWINGKNKDLYHTFKDLKDFNRWAKKWLDMNFKKIIDIEESDGYKAMLINGSLAGPTHLRIKLSNKEGK